MNLSMLLDIAADGLGDRIILGEGDDGVTAAQLDQLSAEGAKLIRAAGAGAVIYLGINGRCLPAALFACARSGVPLVPLNYRLSDEQIGDLVRRHPAAIAVADLRFHPLLNRLGVPTRTPAQWLDATGERVDPGGGEATDETTDEPAVVIYTSGTTSQPKGVLLAHDNLVSYVLGSVEFASAAVEDASLISVPPYHIAAIANAISNLYAGRRCVVLEQFTGERWLETVRREKITHALVVPRMLAQIVEAHADLSVPSLRSLAYGGATMPRRVLQKALREWPHVDFANAYGLTETSSTIAVLGPDDHRAALSSDDADVRARLGSAGRALPGVQIEIRDSDDRRVPAGTVGRILVRGDQVSGTYTHSGSVLDANGFFDTRDQGCLDEAGYLFVGGRTDDTIIRGGENIAPAEIEDALLEYAGVVDAVVVGVPDDQWGQRLEAAIVVEAPGSVGIHALRDHVRARLRSAKTPDRIVIWNELPRNDLGKIVRRHVVDRLTKLTPGEGPRPIVGGVVGGGS
jgi:acyl-CoA synthetase (AMP-forming)/AMP-acid ligase II